MIVGQEVEVAWKVFFREAVGEFDGEESGESRAGEESCRSGGGSFRLSGLESG